ncbi:MAG TPA: glycosyltransferase family 4 protein [Polyangiaceae bacterium]|jgi:glycosyltransferase involved in cell wall biosynthesis|nr:glycosyltransferase family 4 protein [Polyangiaceae bacterium]
MNTVNAPARICILTERQVGIGSAAAAIEPHLRARPGVEWTDITYHEDGGVLERLPLPGRLAGTLRGVLQARSAIKKRRAEALFFLTHNPAVLQPRALAGTPTVLWTDVTPALLDEQAAQYDHPVTSSRIVGMAKHAAVRHTFRRAALCVGWSHWARRSFCEDYGVPEARTAVVPPGVDLERWTFVERAHAEPMRLLFVGGNFARKGGDLLLDVFRQHFRGRAELHLVTRDAVPEEPGVRVYNGLTATSPELLALYRTATVFVLPTRGDCFSIASLEAMATGLPVVVSGVGGIPEIVESGSSGYLVSPNDGRALKESLEALVADPARVASMGARSRAIVERRFDAKRTADELMNMLTSVTERRPPSS